ncbi:hypothetical protein SAMN04487983_10944 [Streptomyces sp. yr375]|uniref:DUF6602 domain-containing protein n=1 Tax=Streptomyces sp. yr375 TaxID=1761906 RepID=UPI0008C288F6|nr:DUF6602 domain-containing protein [Streptomyces sp. yr375]SES49843.1 hypothetical protein SAMN04487983_10944 [Streptomyces sp. yr375]
MNIVEQYWASAVSRLQAEVDGFNKLIGHAGEQGRENELSLARLLENLIPRRLGIGSGVVIDKGNGRSKQTDIIIYDLADQPTLMAQSTQVIFPIEVVHAVIEVKTTLTADEVKDCAEKKVSIDTLKPAESREAPFFGVLAYEAWASPKTVASHLRGIPEGNRADCICILNPGIIGSPDTVDQNKYDVELVALHERNHSGSRTGSSWIKVQKPPADAALSMYGSTYPVTKLADVGYIAGEPGRALLLFCDALLRALSARGVIPNPALSHYLTDTARETLDVQ